MPSKSLGLQTAGEPQRCQRAALVLRSAATCSYCNYAHRGFPNEARLLATSTSHSPSPQSTPLTAAFSRSTRGNSPVIFCALLVCLRDPGAMVAPPPAE